MSCKWNFQHLELMVRMGYRHSAIDVSGVLSFTALTEELGLLYKRNCTSLPASQFKHITPLTHNMYVCACYVNVRSMGARRQRVMNVR